MGVKRLEGKPVDVQLTSSEIVSKSIVVALTGSRGNHKGCPYRIVMGL